jgi:hypothetical protein
VLRPGKLAVGGSGRLKPGINDFDARAVEVRHVAGRQHGAVGAAGGRNQRVEAGDRSPGPFAAAGDGCVVLRGGIVDQQYLIGEGREDLVSRREEDLLSAPVRQPGDAVSDLPIRT